MTGRKALVSGNTVELTQVLTLKMSEGNPIAFTTTAS
jgi:hypothetical protein